MSYTMYLLPFVPKCNENDCKIVRVRSDHDGEFENKDLVNFFDSNGIVHDFYVPRTPQ